MANSHWSRHSPRIPTYLFLIDLRQIARSKPNYKQ